MKRIGFILLLTIAVGVRANEIPLILEETITMPAATQYWDVMPHFWHYYYWVGARGTIDTTTLIQWGQTQTNNFDSLIIGPGTPTYIQCVYGNDYDPQIVLSTRRHRGGGQEWIDETAWSSVRNLSNGEIQGAVRTWNSSRSNSFNSGGSRTGYRILESIAFPPPPMITLRHSTVVVHYHFGWSSGQIGYFETTQYAGEYVHNLISGSNTGNRNLLQCNCVSSTQWADGAFVSKYGERDDGHSGPSGSGHEIWTQTTIFEALVDTTEDRFFRNEIFPSIDEQQSYSCVLINDLANNRIVSTGSQLEAGLKAWSSNSETPEWEIANSYSTFLSAYVLHGEYSEQILALNAETRSFDVIMIEDGDIWGQTSALDSGYAEMKIIGRYHEEYLRLVVRYGNELRIYRFGDPIIVAVDEIPALPNEFSIAVYPNPFNPSTTIEFSLPRAQSVKLEVFDITGRSERVLLDEMRNAGTHAVTFDGQNLASGIYFARMEGEGFVKTEKMVLMR